MEHSIAFYAKKYGIEPLKKYGQNFIFDMSLCRKIVKFSKISEGAQVLEIGPGTAGLTRAILELAPSKFYVIEKDKKFLPLLEDLKANNPNFEIINLDALSLKLGSLGLNNLNIISNLPYNIATKLLTNWLTELDLISSITIMLQKEVANRIKGAPGSKEYGRLSIITNLLCTVEKCFDVSRQAFYPPPKVESSIIRLVPKKTSIDRNVIKIVEEITNKAFSQRRKTLKSLFKNLKLEEAAATLNIADNLRPENLSPEDYLNLATFSLKSSKLGG